MVPILLNVRGMLRSFALPPKQTSSARIINRDQRQNFLDARALILVQNDFQLGGRMTHVLRQF
jgi:hypothetical protein